LAREEDKDYIKDLNSSNLDSQAIKFKTIEDRIGLKIKEFSTKKALELDLT